MKLGRRTEEQFISKGEADATENVINGCFVEFKNYAVGLCKGFVKKYDLLQ